MRDAVIAALNINIFARHADRVRMANIAQMVNVLQAMILTNQDKLVLTPTYHLFHMYVPFQDATFLPVSFDAGTYRNGDIELPKLDAIAAKGKDGKTWLAITNIDPTGAAQVELSTRAKRATGKILAAPKIDSVNTFEAPATVQPKPFSAKASGSRISLKLPPHSVAVIALEE
jgi:alpha-N-arabinofuranosidase